MDVKDNIKTQKSYDIKLALMRPALLRFCRNRVYNLADAEDIVQNTISILIEKQKEYNPNKDFWNWAITICNFQILKYLKDKKRNLEDDYDFCDYSEEADSQNNSIESFAYFLNKVDENIPFNILLKKELQKEKEKIINDIKDNRMTKGEKKFFEYQLNGWSKKDIMYAMKITATYYNVWKSRVIARLKENIISK